MSKKMLTRIITAVCVIAVVSLPIALGGIWMRALEVFIGLIGGYETAKITDGKNHPFLTVLNFAAIAAVGIAPAGYMPVVTSIWAVILFAIILIDQEKNTDFTAYTFIVTMILGMTVRTVDTFYFGEGGLGWRGMLYVLLATFVTDTGAYFFGVFFGKHKMIPKISPNKTWEGSIGGYASALAVSMIYGLLVLKSLPSALIICGSLVLPVVAQIGDLSYSAIKRRFDIKDFGNLLPEHGGVLDRIDSLTFTLAVFNALMILWGI